MTGKITLKHDTLMSVCRKMFFNVLKKEHKLLFKIIF